MNSTVLSKPTILLEPSLFKQICRTKDEIKWNIVKYSILLGIKPRCRTPHNKFDMLYGLPKVVLNRSVFFSFDTAEKTTFSLWHVWRIMSVSIEFVFEGVTQLFKRKDLVIYLWFIFLCSSVTVVSVPRLPKTRLTLYDNYYVPLLKILNKFFTFPALFLITCAVDGQTLLKHRVN